MDTEHRASIAWQVFEESNDAIIVTDNDNKIIDVNPFTQRVTQYRRSELLAMTLFDVLDGGDRTVDEMILALRETGVFHSRESFELRCNHGIRRHVNISVSRLHISQQVFGVVIARDISERVANQEALKAANEELEKRVVQRTAEYQAANERLVDEAKQRQLAHRELQQVNQQLAETIQSLKTAEQSAIKQEQFRIAGRLARGMAHEINNSVTPILNIVETLEMDDRLDHEHRQYLEQIKMSSMNISTNVERLREIQPVHSELRYGPLDLVVLINSVVRLTKPRWYAGENQPKKEIAFCVPLEESLSINADEMSLRTVLSNLIFNAIDAIETRGTITVTCEQRNESVVIQVTDDGHGMTEKQLESCFDAFVSFRHDGCGLGLTLCRRIVEEHGGTISISSEYGRGTTARIELPQTTDDIKPKFDTSNVGKHQRFLVVEDDAIVRSSIQVLLEVKGKVVEVAADAAEAIERLQKREFDVVITDFSLPEMNGAELLQECRNRWPQTQTVLISGWIDAAREDVKHAHITMQKPFQINELFERLVQSESPN